MGDVDPKLELYKLEYERGAVRYEDIYKSVWTNFSYMAIVAGGILTFGSNFFREHPNWLALLACLPLFFWYMATFIPLNYYGDEARRRLGRIEETVNQEYGTELSHYRNYASGAANRAARFTGPPSPHVRKFVWCFFLLLGLATVWFGLQICEAQARAATLLQVDNVKNPAALAGMFKNPATVADEGKRKASEHLLGRFSPDTKKLLDGYAADTRPPSELLRAIVNELNRVIEGGSLYEKAEFKRLPDMGEAERLAAGVKDSSDLANLNRTVLGSVYRQEINSSRWPSERLAAMLFLVVLGLFEICGLHLGYRQAFARGKNIWVVALKLKDGAVSQVTLMDLKKFDAHLTRGGGAARLLEVELKPALLEARAQEDKMRVISLESGGEFRLRSYAELKTLTAAAAVDE